MFANPDKVYAESVGKHRLFDDVSYHLGVRQEPAGRIGGDVPECIEAKFEMPLQLTVPGRLRGPRDLLERLGGVAPAPRPSFGCMKELDFDLRVGMHGRDDRFLVLVLHDDVITEANQLATPSTSPLLV
jgi:hypothetical protein